MSQTRSDTRNVKLGTCTVTLDGVDLGYTKGGVEFSVTTSTKKVMVDQFGDSEIDEIIMGRSAKVKVPLAETTLENLVRIMPGATLRGNGGAKATGTVTFVDRAARQRRQGHGQRRRLHVQDRSDGRQPERNGDPGVDQRRGHRARGGGQRLHRRPRVAGDGCPLPRRS
jgi:hypothetical protein